MTYIEKNFNKIPGYRMSNDEIAKLKPYIEKLKSNMSVDGILVTPRLCNNYCEIEIDVVANVSYIDYPEATAIVSKMNKTMNENNQSNTSYTFRLITQGLFSGNKEFTNFVCSPIIISSYIIYEKYGINRYSEYQQLFANLQPLDSLVAIENIDELIDEKTVNHTR